jgi:hypothetical protein
MVALLGFFADGDAGLAGEWRTREKSRLRAIVTFLLPSDHSALGQRLIDKLGDDLRQSLDCGADLGEVLLHTRRPNTHKLRSIHFYKS